MAISTTFFGSDMFRLLHPSELLDIRGCRDSWANFSSLLSKSKKMSRIGICQAILSKLSFYGGVKGLVKVPGTFYGGVKGLVDVQEY